MSQVTVNPCPFCGHDDVEIDEIELGIIAVCCPECQTIGPHTDGTHSIEEAIAKWNKAPRPAAPSSMLAGLLAQLAQAPQAPRVAQVTSYRSAAEIPAGDVRRKILDELDRGTRLVTDLADAIGCETRKLYTPLQRLKRDGLIVSVGKERQGSQLLCRWQRSEAC